MPSTPQNDDFVREIARYHQEMIQTARRSAFRETDAPQQNEQPQNNVLLQPPTKQPPLQEPRFTDIESDGNPHQDERGVPNPPAADNNAPSAPSDMPRDATGYLRIQTFTAREASPVPNAHITVYEETDNGDILITSVITDESGISPTIPLPTVSATLSQQPEDFNPYITYAITTDANGYYRVTNRRIPIFGGIVSNQPVFLVPLPEQSADNEPPLVYSQDQPNDLNR